MVGLIWIFCSLFGVGLFPIFEGRKTLAYTFKSIILDLTGKGHPGKNRDMFIEGEGDDKSGPENSGQDVKILGSKESPEEFVSTEK